MKTILYFLIVIFGIISPAFTNKSKSVSNNQSSHIVIKPSNLLFDSSTSHQTQELNIQEKTFEYLWKQFDNNYSLFEVKNIDWQQMYETYRSQVTDSTSDDELFNILSGMIAHFDDNHVGLYGDNKPFRLFWSNRVMNKECGGFGEEGHKKFEACGEKSNIRPVPENYFIEKISKSAKGNFEYAWLPDSIGYVYFKVFRNIEECTIAIDSVVGKFKYAKAIIIDKRECGGGSDAIGKVIADRFADRKRLYSFSHDRNGQKHTDFEPLKYCYLEPGGPLQFTKNVILLTDHTTGSASEVFAMCMRTLPYVTIIGDTTSGCFGDAYGEFLPNKWQFMCTYGLITDRDGVCWEGIGIIPDIYQINTLEDKQAGKDKVLELAVNLINTNSLKIKKNKVYKEDSYISLLKVLQEYRNCDLKSAKRAFYKAKSENRGAYYLNWDEMMNFAGELEKEGKVDYAIEILKMAIDEFPNTIYLYERLARTCNDAGKTEMAKIYYKKLIDKNRLSYPWEKAWDKDAKKVLNGETLPKECKKSCTCSQ